MRHFILYAGMFIVAAHAQAQTVAAPPAESTTPPLTKTVTIDPNDSPMVRAAKRAVASRVNPAQRRVVSLTSTNTRGRLAIATGPTEGPRIPPAQTPPGPSGEERQRASVKEVGRLKAVAETEKQEKLKQLAVEEGLLGTEMDEPYGNDVDEDRAVKRLSEIEAERKKLQETTPPPPPNP